MQMGEKSRNALSGKCANDTKRQICHRIRGAFHSRDLATAKSCSDLVWSALRLSIVSSDDELLSLLCNLSSELSHGVQIASLLSSHIGVDLSYLVKIASNTE